MTDFIEESDRLLLERSGLNSFDALWAVQLEAVDEPNIERGGWSSVFRLELDGAAFYLKRQSNHLTRSLTQPFGEPTFAREFRSIRRYARLGIPALQASFFGQRRVNGERRAVLLTRALDGWTDLDGLLAQWPQLAESQRQSILQATGELARILHRAGQLHGCFYPKHIFLREEADGFHAQLIDLEKTRGLWFGQRDRIKDLEPLLRRAGAWSEAEVSTLLLAYVGSAVGVPAWRQRLNARQRNKEARR